MNFGLNDITLKKIISAIKSYKAVQRAVIFGSRARGDYQYNSDIDIAVYTDGQSITGLLLDLEDAAGIYKINMVIMNRLDNEKLKENIERDGIELILTYPHDHS